ncbi:type IV secretion protein IcmD [bacterium]|jgi:hypothetical protein|nr:type IV secretion protein IcmD [bacterium]
MKVKNKMLAIAAGLFMSNGAFAGASSGISVVATQVQSQFGAIALLISSAAYIAGLGLIVAGILKLKAYKDNPQQTPLGVPMTMLGIGGLLVYLNGLVQAVGGTFFGTAGTTAGVTGTSGLG